MVEVPITAQMIKNATEKATELGELNNSITKGDGNFAGFLGEEIALKIIGGRLENTSHYDLIDDKGQTWDVKTKRCTSAPKGYYECSVADYNTIQKCDNYAFVRIEFKNDRPTRAWFLGGYIKKNYYRDARFLRAGDYDPDNNYTVKADCYNLPINKLYQKGL